MIREGMPQPSPDAAFIPESAAESLEQLRAARERLAPPLGKAAELGVERGLDAPKIGGEALDGVGIEVLAPPEQLSGDRQYFHFTYRGEEILESGALKPRSEHNLGGARAESSNGVHFTSPPLNGDIAHRRCAYDSAYMEFSTNSTEKLGTDNPLRMAVVLSGSSLMGGAAIMEASAYGDEDANIDERDINDCLFYDKNNNPSSFDINDAQIIVFGGIDKRDITQEEQEAVRNMNHEEKLKMTRDLLFRQRFEKHGYSRDWFDKHVSTGEELESTLVPLEQGDTMNPEGGFLSTTVANQKVELPPGVIMRTCRDYLRNRFNGAVSVTSTRIIEGGKHGEALDDDGNYSASTSRIRLRFAD